MTLYFVSQPSSPFYDSATFSHVITYAMSHVRQCALNETDDHHRSMRLTSIDSIKSAVNTYTPYCTLKRLNLLLETEGKKGK